MAEGTTGGRARALSFTGPRRVELTDVDVPEPGEGEVLVRTLWSGISAGTEMLAYRGEIDPGVPLDERIGSLGGTFSYPFRYGYSCVGRVERSPGGAVAEDAVVFSLHPHQEAFVAPVVDVVVVEGVDPRQATLFPLVETAFQVALDAGPVLDETVVVTGLGAVGLLVSVLLQRGGARVLASDPLEWRRAAAAAAGVDAVSDAEVSAAVSEHTGGRGVSLLVEASGQPEALRNGLALLAHEGEALVASWYGTKEVALPLGGNFHRRRLRIRSTQVSTIPAHLASRWTVGRRRAAVGDLLPELPLSLIATHQFPFERAADAFAAVDRCEPGLMHVALRYD